MTKILSFLKGIFTSNNIIYIFIIVGLLVYIFLDKKSSSTKIIQDQYKIDSISVRIDTLEERVNALNPKIEDNKKSIDTVKQIIRTNDFKIKNIQESAKKRDSAILSLNTDQLQKYFSEY